MALWDSRPDKPIIVAGAGLAGACAALFLARHASVVLVDPVGPAGGASGAAAGLVNPLMAQKAHRVWHLDEASAALEEVVSMANAESFIDRRPILRPARDTQQAQFFFRSAQDNADLAEWVSPQGVQQHHPAVAAPFGALLIPKGSALDVARFTAAVVGSAERSGVKLESGWRVRNWTEEGHTVRVTLTGTNGNDPRTIDAAGLLLCVGASFHTSPPLNVLNLHRLKGQLVRVKRPAILDDLPHVSGSGYIVHTKDDLILGSTYEHRFVDEKPDPEKATQIIARAALIVPALTEAKPRDSVAGIRVTVPGSRLPMVGPLPDRRHVWIFTGLGAKGLLMAPLISRALPGYLRNPDTVPALLQVTSRSS